MRNPKSVICAILYLMWFKRESIIDEGIVPLFQEIKKELAKLDFDILSFLGTDGDSNLDPGYILSELYHADKLSWDVVNYQRQYSIKEKFVPEFKSHLASFNEGEKKILNLATDRGWVNYNLNVNSNPKQNWGNKAWKRNGNIQNYGRMKNFFEIIVLQNYWSYE